MTIDREKLIQLLVSKTGFEREKVETQLSELISRIKRAAREGKSFEIEGFGTFSIGDDELNFEPADELETEVNHKYAGMEPIELIGAYDDAEEELESEAEEKAGADAGEETEPEDLEPTPEPEMESDVEEPEEEDEVWGIDESSPLADEISKARTEEEEQEDQGYAEDREEPEVTGTTEEDIEEVLDSLEDESVLEDAAEEESPEETKEPEPDKAKKARWEPGNELRSAPREKQTPKPKPKSAKKKKDPIGTILVVFLVLIVVGVGGWFVYDTGLFSGLISTVTGGNGNEVASATQPQSQTTARRQQQSVPSQQQRGSQPQATPPPQEEQQQSSAAARENNRQQAGQSPEPDGENEVATGGTETQPLFGLKGEVNPDTDTGYTIVVYSLQNESRARQLMNNLSEEGYRAVLTEAVVNGNTYWRVGLGQFETVNDAQAAAGDLREPFSNNFFIKRIE